MHFQTIVLRSINSPVIEMVVSFLLHYPTVFMKREISGIKKNQSSLFLCHARNNFTVYKKVHNTHSFKLQMFLCLCQETSLNIF
jgi:hypothetical protein